MATTSKPIKPAAKKLPKYTHFKARKTSQLPKRFNGMEIDPAKIYEVPAEEKQSERFKREMRQQRYFEFFTADPRLKKGKAAGK